MAGSSDPSLVAPAAAAAFRNATPEVGHDVGVLGPLRLGRLLLGAGQVLHDLVLHGVVGGAADGGGPPEGAYVQVGGIHVHLVPR